jgi:uncharacterized protein involved in exopolysaccharide biosynthesis
MAWSNNAENIYSFRINRVEPLNIRYLSRLLGPVRYDFYYGSLKGHIVPRNPWVHPGMFSFRPTDNFEFGFERTVIIGGEGHAPVTLHTFLHSFFDTNDTSAAEKAGRDDPGARFSDFSFSYRVPLLRKYATFYVDSISHDDVTPISAPRRAAFRTGMYLSHIPKAPGFDFRAEAVSTDPNTGRSLVGEFNYWETIQKQGYTNKGIIMGDWIGREAKGGQAWVTYHLSANEWIQLSYLNKKTPHDFIPGGTTQNQFKAAVVKRLGKEVELNAWVQYEGWKKSDSLMLTVCREMDLSNNADFLEKKGPIPHTSLDDGEVRQDTVHRLQSNLRITLVPKTDIIRISYSSLDPKLSANIVNKVISDYVQRSYQTRFESSQRVSVWLSGTLEGLKQEVETSQEQMMDMQRKLGILGFDPNHNQISASLDDLAKAAGTAKLARIIAEARYRVVSGMDPNSIEGTIDTTPGTAPAELNTLRGQLAAAKATYATLESSLGPNHPQAKAQKAQIDEYVRQINDEQNRLVLQAKQSYIVARTNEDQTTAALEAQKTDAYKLRDQLVEYTLREREYEANRTLYDGLQQRLRTASVQSGLESLEVDVVDQALPPANPVLRPQSTVILTALIFSLLAGIVVAFLMESLDTGLRSIAEIESITELPSLAIIPRARRSSADQAATLTTAQRNIGILTQPKSQLRRRSVRFAPRCCYPIPGVLRSTLC